MIAVRRRIAVRDSRGGRACHAGHDRGLPADRGANSGLGLGTAIFPGNEVPRRITQRPADLAGR